MTDAVHSENTVTLTLPYIQRQKKFSYDLFVR